MFGGWSKLPKIWNAVQMLIIQASNHLTEAGTIEFGSVQSELHPASEIVAMEGFSIVFV